MGKSNVAIVCASHNWPYAERYAGALGNDFELIEIVDQDEFFDAMKGCAIDAALIIGDGEEFVGAWMWADSEGWAVPAVYLYLPSGHSPGEPGLDARAYADSSPAAVAKAIQFHLTVVVIAERPLVDITAAQIANLLQTREFVVVFGPGDSFQHKGATFIAVRPDVLEKLMAEPALATKSALELARDVYEVTDSFDFVFKD